MSRPAPARRFVAPGKVVLIGEYAVVDGAPAVVAAVDRGVACVVEPSPTLRINTPSDDRFVRPALEAVGAPPAHYDFFDHNPAPTADKAGLGGSAAATVVACLAGSAMAGRALDPAALHEVARAVHHGIQGSGSGIDVAAAAHGGVLVFEGSAVRPTTAHPVHLAYSGSSASTGPRVAQFRAWAAADPQGHSAFVQQSRALVTTFAADPIATLRAAGDALGAMAEAAGIVYWTPGLRRLVALAEAHGGGAKPSGAGGGDIVVAAFPDTERASQWERACRAEGFVPIAITITAGAHEVR